MKKTLAALCLTLFALPALADFNNNLYINYDLTHAKGFWQIPIGGQPGTSSVQRPTLSELDSQTWQGLGIGYARSFNSWEVKLQYQQFFTSDHATLTQTLISHGQTFVNGSYVNDDLKIRDLSAKVGYNLFWKQLFLIPNVGIIQDYFDYDLKNYQVEASRDFSATSFGIGLDAIYPFNPNYSLIGSVFTTIPSLNLQQQTAAIGIDAIVMQRQNFQVDVVPMLYYRYIDFEDSQAMPNHVQVTMWPDVQIGVNVRF